ncbi:MAG: hypothetical protein V3S83_09975 [Gemmatimonadota bacterium]
MPSWEIIDLLTAGAITVAVLVPIIGFTIRFALKPFITDLAKLKTGETGNVLAARVADQEQRLATLEQHLGGIETSLHELNDAIAFDRQLSPSSKREGDA